MKHSSAFLIGIVLLATGMFAGHAAAQDCVEPPPGLVSWWPGDTDASDIGGMKFVGWHCREKEGRCSA
jgi:hypothetical protein